MKCQLFFSEKNKKIMINLSSAEFAHSALNVNLHMSEKIKCTRFFSSIFNKTGRSTPADILQENENDWK